MRQTPSILRIALVAAIAGAALPATAKPRPPEAAPKKFGQALSGGKALPLATLLAAPDAYAGKSALIEGTVRAACTKKGCWMELAPTVEKGSQGCRVTFQDYGFFVPLDSAGAHARVQGVVSVRNVPMGEVAHMEGEGGTFSNKQKDGSAREVQIIATGVELRR